MRLHRFFITPPSQPITVGEKIEVTDAALIHQWRKVFRFKGARETVILLPNSGVELVSEVVSIDDKKAVVEIVASNTKETRQKKIVLFQSIIKGDHFELVLEKCTELGVSHFVPIVAERSEKKNINLERAKKIVKEASEQSGKTTLPLVNEVMTLEEVFAPPHSPLLGKEGRTEKTGFNNFTPEFSFALDHSGSPLSTNNLKLTTANFFIGPEGGWTDRERELFRSKNIPLLSLGEQILRSETAAIAVSSLLLL